MMEEGTEISVVVVETGRPSGEMQVGIASYVRKKETIH